MSKIESSAGKALYEQQETKLSQQSAAFIELLTKRGILGDSSIDDDRVRQAKKEKKKSMYHNTLEKPAAPHSVVTATDGSTWYQMASGEGRNAFYDAPGFTGSPAESEQVAAAFPGAAEGTVLRNTGDGIMEAGSESGNSLWYNSAYYNEPEAPHTVMQAANGVDWYAMQQHAEAPAFEQGEAADTYNQAALSIMHRVPPGTM